MAKYTKGTKRSPKVKPGASITKKGKSRAKPSASKPRKRKGNP